MKSIAVGIVVCLVTGCATKEGIALPVAKPTQSEVADFTKHQNCCRGSIAAEPIANSTPTDTDPRRSDQERATLNPATGRDEVAQLQKLKQLLDKELITQDEYDRKRKEILDHL